MQIAWSMETYTPHELISKTFPMFIRIESGGDENLNLKPKQIIRLEKFDKQKRILIKDQRSRYLTVPRNFPMKFLVKSSNVISKKKRNLKQFKGAKLKYILRQYFDGAHPLLLDFDYGDPWKFKVGTEITNSRDFGSIFLETINTMYGPVNPKITEHFLKGHFLTRDYSVVTDKKPIIIPTTTNIKLRIAHGFDMENGDSRWREFNDYSKRVLARSFRSTFFTEDGTMEILMPDMSSLPKHLNYDFPDNESTTTGFSEQTLSGITNGSQKMFNSYNANGTATAINGLDEASNEMRILTVESEKIRVDEENNDISYGTSSRKFEERSEKIEREVLESITKSEGVVDVEELYSSVDRRHYRNKDGKVRSVKNEKDFARAKVETREEGIQTSVEIHAEKPSESIIENNKSEISLTVSKDEDQSTLRRYQKVHQQPNYQQAGMNQPGMHHPVTTMPRIVRRLKPNDYQSASLPRPQQPVVYLQKAQSTSNLLAAQQPIYLAQNPAGIQTAYVLQPVQLGGQPMLGPINQQPNAGGGHISVLQVGNGIQRSGSMPSLYSQPVQAVNLQRAKSPGPASVRVVNM